MEQERFTLKVVQDLHEIPDLRKVMSMQFYFKKTRFNQDPCAVIFAQRDCIIEFNFQTKETHKMCTFEVPLVRQPEFFTMNPDQSISVVAAIANGIYFNHNTRDQIDLDDLLQIKEIKEVIHAHEEGYFYVLANKYQERLGLFMIRIDEDNPSNH